MQKLARHPCPDLSWKPDPGAAFIDAFSITWDKQLFHAFPPFSLIARRLQKIQTDSAEGFMIVPMWPTQSWYPKPLHMLVDVPRILPSQQTSLQMPGMKQEVYSLAKKLVLIVCRLSGSATRQRDFRKRQPLLPYSLGGKEPLSSTHHTSKEGLHIAVQNRLIQFLPLYPKR